MARGKNKNRWKARKAFQRTRATVRTLSGEIVFEGDYKLTNNGHCEAREAVQITVGRGRTSDGSLRRYKRRQLESQAGKLAEYLDALSVTDVEIHETDRAETGDDSGRSYQACLRCIVPAITDFQRDLLRDMVDERGGAIDFDLLEAGRYVAGKLNTDELLPVGKRVCYSTKKGGAKRTTPVDAMDSEHVDRRDSGLCGDRPDVTRDLRPIPAPATH